ncbi:unnamed protein product [Lepeophtheirus salmonis]|uniref:(salmon louse) hypothetical protein n=1 Tax=Lepeophtheirus salmonis TaxID=72036 RepID=A0A7R8CMG5_LEPSM|nr:unnamed protein product [Lepeophtheirus salmonis]CAF2866306.1 unnamed protein product [Lepeophtheirus salmonis]
MFGFLNQEEEGSFSRTERWGTLSDNEWNASPLSAAEREALIRLPRPLPLDGPRIHQPRPDSSGDIRLRSDSCQDPYVHNGIKLLAHMRKSQDGTKQPPISLGDLTFFKTQSEPPFGVKSLCSHLHSEKTSFAEGKYPDSTAHKFKLTSRSTRQMLHKSVATICAFVGYETASLGALDLLTDVVAEYLRTFTKLLRDSRDRECLYEQKEWKKRKTASSSSSTTILVGSNSAEIILGEDDIPEIHFPSGEECTGDHATPQYETGLQVLQSLEQAGVMIPNEDPVESIGLSPGNNRKRRRTEDQKTI